MSRKFKVFVVVLSVLAVLLASQKASAAPLESSEIEANLEAPEGDIENVFYEIKELKRVTRQCPFSGGAGPFGGGANGQGPDVQQLLTIARTVLNALDQGGAAGGFPAGGVGGDPNVDANVLGRLRRRG